jgi:hypothetical protein
MSQMTLMSLPPVNGNFDWYPLRLDHRVRLGFGVHSCQCL